MTISSIVSLFQSFIPGKRLIDGSDLLTMAKLQFSYKSGIVALAGGGQAGATPLPAFINEVSTVVTNADSVMLPAGIPGLAVVVINDGASTLQVYGVPANPNNGGTGDTIAPNTSVAQAATGTGVSQATVKASIYYCFAPGKWKQLTTA
jgi:hypothetical protein